MVSSAMSDSFRAICVVLAGLAVITMANGELVLGSSRNLAARSSFEEHTAAGPAEHYHHSDGVLDSIDAFLAEEGIGRHLRPKKKKKNKTETMTEPEEDESAKSRRSPTNLRDCLLDALESEETTSSTSTTKATPLEQQLATAGPSTPFPSTAPTVQPTSATTTTSTWGGSWYYWSTTLIPTGSAITEPPTAAIEEASMTGVSKTRRRQGRRLEKWRNEKESMNEVFQSFIDFDSDQIDDDDEYDIDDEEEDEEDEDDEDDDDDSAFKPVKYYRPPSWLSGHTYDQMNRQLATCSSPSTQQQVKVSFQENEHEICSIREPFSHTARNTYMPHAVILPFALFRPYHDVTNITIPQNTMASIP